MLLTGLFAPSLSRDGTTQAGNPKPPSTPVEYTHKPKGGKVAFEDPMAPIFSRFFATDIPPNKRIEIKSAPDNRIDFYSGEAGEIAPGSLATDLTQLQLTGPTVNDGTADVPGSRISVFPGGINYETFPYPTGDHTLDGGHLFYGRLESADNEFAPVANADITNASTNSTTYTGVTGGNTMTITMRRPLSGRLNVSIYSALSGTVAGMNVLTSFEIRQTNGAGTILVAASDSRALLFQPPLGGSDAAYGATFLVEGLTSVPNGDNIWIQMQHRVSANTGNWAWRRMTAQPMF